MTIHATSYNLLFQNYAVYNSIVYRLINIPLSPENNNKEVHLIKNIDKANDYHSGMIDKLIIKLTITTNNRRPKVVRTYLHALNIARHNKTFYREN